MQTYENSYFCKAKVFIKVKNPKECVCMTHLTEQFSTILKNQIFSLKLEYFNFTKNIKFLFK